MAPTAPVPPPPPPPPASTTTTKPVSSALPPPVVAGKGPPGAFLVELVVFNGYPYKDHWAYWIRSHASPEVGVMIHAKGSVLHGFEFEIKRSFNFQTTGNPPTERIPLQWVDAKYFNEADIFNGGKFSRTKNPICGFERSANKVMAPAKSLNAVDELVSAMTIPTCSTYKSEDTMKNTAQNIAHNVMMGFTFPPKLLLIQS